MRLFLRPGLALAALAAVLAPVADAAAADYSGRRAGSRHAPDAVIHRDYHGILPACADPSVQRRIAHRFASRERGYWRSDLELVAFGHTRELGYRNWGLEFIPRRFCSAATKTTDGRDRKVFYEIGEGFGFAGVGWDVQWCVTGLDRNLAYAPNCKMARP